MLDLKNLGAPSEFWEYFIHISKIPRCSRNEEKIRNYIKEEAEKFGFITRTDNIGNLAVQVPSKSDHNKKIILQCHLDMICEKNEGIIHDFTKDPLKLKIIDVDEEKWLTAEGTTLGADNGTGICYILTLMKKINKKELEFESLGFDFLFTVREEYDMGGAKKIDKGLIHGQFLINLDSGGENNITIGCVGGISIKARIYTNLVILDQSKEIYIPIKLFCRGLRGGHSGEDSNKGRGNAIKILSQILWKLNRKYEIHLNAINGGNAANAIPREANAIIFIRESEYSEVFSQIMEYFTEIKKVFNGIELDIDFTIDKLNNYSDKKVLPKNIQDKLFTLLFLLPSGALSMHPKISNLAFASTNLGVIKTKKNYIKIRMLHRSFSKFYNEEICKKVFELMKMSGLEMERIIRGTYPPWIPDFNSSLLRIANRAHQDTFNKQPNIKAVHGGLEATLLINHFPELEAIAIGPTNKSLHSPNEMLSIKSVGNTWNFLLNILKRIEENNKKK
ncbi:MAG: beta-Ala-His dipeptidase [Candidatus Odinarchaeota archaeon]